MAAFFCEPIQGSGGVIVPPAGWLKAMREAARELDILFVVDEVITGFGRTGPMFACDAEGVEPDLMTLAKGLTSGYVPMGATMLSEEVYAAIADGAPAGAPIGHGATYSAHPVGAAVALEVLRLYEEGGVLANGQRVAPHFAAGLEALRAHPLVGDARHRGLLGALELVSDKATKRAFDPALGLPDRVFAAAWRNGVVFRCFGDAMLGFAPALTYTEAEFDQLFARLTRTLDDVLAQPEVRAALAMRMPATSLTPRAIAMTEAFKLDRLDLRILAQLQKNGRMTNVDLADAVGLSPSPCLIRVKRLEQAGYIAGYGAHLRLEKLGDTLTVFTEVTLQRPPPRGLLPLRDRDPRRRRDHGMPSGQRRLRLPAALPDARREPLPAGHRRPARAQHRHREVLQLHRHQVAVHEDALPDRAAVPGACGLRADRRFRAVNAAQAR